jgi:NAD(P)H-dependent FMN reductase
MADGLIIVWHSRTGAAQAMAEAAMAGAGDGARIFTAAEASPDAMMQSEAYLFICPENLGTMSGAMKEFFDRCYYPLLGRIEGRPYATAIAAGSDGRGAQAQIDRIVTGWRLRRVAEGLIVNLGVQSPEAILAPKTVSPEQLLQCQQLGAALGEGLRLGIF